MLKLNFKVYHGVLTCESQGFFCGKWMGKQ